MYKIKEDPDIVNINTESNDEEESNMALVVERR